MAHSSLMDERKRPLAWVGYEERGTYFGPTAIAQSCGTAHPLRWPERSVWTPRRADGRGPLPDVHLRRSVEGLPGGCGGEDEYPQTNLPQSEFPFLIVCFFGVPFVFH